jgi:hypothetical protein
MYPYSQGITSIKLISNTSLTIVDLVGGPNWFGIIITNWCCSVQMVWVHESRTALMKHILIGCLVESDFNPSFTTMD